MDSNNLDVVQSTLDQLTLSNEPEKDNSTSTSQQPADKSHNQRNHSATISEATNFGSSSNPENSLINSNSNTLETFPQFSQLPTELRLMIWKFAGLQPQIIPMVHCSKNILPDYYYPRLTVQQCPLTMTCQESRNEVLSFKQPLRNIFIKPKDGVTQVTDPDPNNDQWDFTEATIYANPDIDTLCLHSFRGTVNTFNIGEAIQLSTYQFSGKRLIIPEAAKSHLSNDYFILPHAIPNARHRIDFGIYVWALGLHLQEIYSVTGDNNFSINKEGIELPQLHDKSSNYELGIPKKMPSSLKQIDEAHKLNFEAAQSRRIEGFVSEQKQCIEDGYEISEEFWQKEREEQRAWVPPKIKYIKESQMNVEFLG